MDTSQCAEVMALSLSIVQSWKRTWAEASKHGNTFITETVLSPIIGWTTLKSSLSQITPKFIIKASTDRATTWQHATSAELPFIVASKKLKSTLELIAVESAISRACNPASVDNRIAHEPAVLARKPLTGTVADNVLTWGTGALNIDGSRVGEREKEQYTGVKHKSSFGGEAQDYKNPNKYEKSTEPLPSGRWPANVILDEHAAEALDEQSGHSVSNNRIGKRTGKNAGTYGAYTGQSEVSMGHTDSGGASRFFYIAKASRAEREAGLEGVELKIGGGMKGTEDGTLLTGSGNERNPLRANHHPTVKPIALMRHLVRLVTPKGGTVLDPFMGSGSTGCAAMMEGMRFVGIDITAEYVDIAERRILHWLNQNPMEL
jgi:site-specific DNA-methyltransferase (adenine-specific)